MKLELCNLLQHLCDCQVQHRIEATVTFAQGLVDSLQEQLEIPQTQHLPCRTLAEPQLSYHLGLVRLSPTPSSAWLQHGWSAAFAQSPASLLCGHSVGLECMCLCRHV